MGLERGAPAIRGRCDPPRNGLSHYRPGRFVEALRGDGFVRVAPTDWGMPPIATSLSDRSSFAESWDRLDADRWMGDGGQYRRRRFAAFSIRDGGIARKPHQAHFQSRFHNRLNGGVARWFSAVEPDIGRHPVTTSLLLVGAELADAVAGWREAGWHAEFHQFRIEAMAHAPGLPTPEGLHHDGVTAVLMMLIRRRNVRGGVTALVEDGRLVAEFTLTRPFEAVIVDDARLCHAVSAVTAADAACPGWRDALVVTFRPDRQCEKSRGIAAPPSRSRVTPPRIISRRRECP